MAKLKELSVFFPAYNEEDNIAESVENALKIMPEFVDDLEVIVVNDGSSDRTKDIAEGLAAKYDNVSVVTHPENRGYGGALKSGFAAARYDHVFFSDGDGQFDLNEIERLMPLAPDCDIVAGFRIKRNDPIHRVINGKAYNILVRILFGLKIRDIDCAFKIIKKDVINAVDLKSESQFLSAEFLIKAKKKGFTIGQVGVHHFPRAKGAQTGNNPLVVIKSFRELFKLWKELR
ncbi:MAG: glycosyltransferase family 2 protein [Candidatus Tantalella remota]|nr:glycosyltransferase family 2 protein [Candidatus Tantalella remota]